MNDRARDPAHVADPVIDVEGLSVWFGAKVAVSELSVSFGPGVTGLLGPNGAGKTTLMRAMAGMVRPNQGRVRVTGRDPRSDLSVHKTLSLVAEDEAVPEDLTAIEFVRYVATLHSAPSGAAEAALASVDMSDSADRRLRGFSKGMRQRVKVAAALSSAPSVLVLDEPLNGADPIQRRALITLFRRLGDEGRTVIVSSHVLHEVERLADRVVVLVNGRLAAAGSRRAIRDTMADRPQRLLVRSPMARELASALLTLESVAWAAVDGESVTVATGRWRELAVAIPKVAKSVGARLLEVRPLDDSLESLFTELVR